MKQVALIMYLAFAAILGCGINSCAPQNSDLGDYSQASDVPSASLETCYVIYSGSDSVPESILSQVDVDIAYQEYQKESRELSIDTSLLSQNGPNPFSGPFPSNIKIDKDQLNTFVVLITTRHSEKVVGCAIQSSHCSADSVVIGYEQFIRLGLFGMADVYVFTNGTLTSKSGHTIMLFR